MFDVSPTEFFTIAVIALIVFGPQRLPEIARKLGGYVSEIRKAANDLRSGLDEEVRQIQTPLNELKTDLTKPVSEIKSTLDETTNAISKPIEDAARAADGEGTGQKVEWIAPEPEVGVKPGEAWEGLGDESPETIAQPEAIAQPEEAEMPGESGTDDEVATATGQADDDVPDEPPA